MAAATPQQIQTFSDTRVRPRSEQIRALLTSMTDDRASFGDIYEALTATPPVAWTDNRTDGPPSLLTGSDLLAWNTFLADIIAAIEANPQLPVILKACVRPVGV